MLTRNKFDRFFYKLVKLKAENANSVPDLATDKPVENITNSEISELKANNKALKIKVLNYMTIIEELQLKLSTANFPEEVIESKINVIIIDSSAVTRAKLKKLFDSEIFTVFLPRDREEAAKMIEDYYFAIAVVEYNSDLDYGFDLIISSQNKIWTEKTKILLTSSNEYISIPFDKSHHISGFITKPWEDKLVVEKIASLVK